MNDIEDTFFSIKKIEMKIHERPHVPLRRPRATYTMPPQPS